jgi:SAM-dependent methyltransferase
METFMQNLLKESEKSFSGWDFNYISETGRMDNEPLSWSYTSIILSYLSTSNALLDMGTGGGEYLSLLSPLPSKTIATEGYKPNVPIAKQRLEPLGIDVFEVTDDENLPFADESFDLIINRHESYSPNEVYRILKTNGVFITQQVGGKDLMDLNFALGASEDTEFAHWNLSYAKKQLEDAHFTVRKSHEEFPYSRFYDIGALVYYLKAIPWQIEDFSVKRYESLLLKLHEKIKRNGYIQFDSHRFFLSCIKKQG